MKNIMKLTKKPKLFQRMVGLSVEDFNLLAHRLEVAWQGAEANRKNGSSRIRALGAGRPYKLNSISLKLLAILLYYKTYLTQECLGFFMDLDQSNISRLISKMRGLIEQAADPQLTNFLQEAKQAYEAIPSSHRVSCWSEFVSRYPDLMSISIDATEQQCQRSQDHEVQKKHYSGKKRLHTIKTQIAASPSGRIIDVSNSYPGSVHDKTVIDTEQTVHKFPENTCLRFDSGYQGVPNQNPEHYAITPIKKPRKKPLSHLAKELNHANGKRRIIVEHAISRIKTFRICKFVYRNPISSYNQVFRDILALLDFRLYNMVTI